MSGNEQHLSPGSATGEACERTGAAPSISYERDATAEEAQVTRSTLAQASNVEREPIVLPVEELRHPPPFALPSSRSVEFPSRRTLKRQEKLMDLHAHTGHRFIESDRMVERLVFDHDGKSLGKITRLLIERRSGRVEQVIVHAHGHFGFGASDFELPWSALLYDTCLPGYRLARGVQITASKEQ